MDGSPLQAAPVDALVALVGLGLVVLIARRLLRVAWKLAVVATLIVVGLWLVEAFASPLVVPAIVP
ncbi:hypothetical protein [Halomarina pelagica]|uniref:hypothetical protein n=1 Tax=Halomarina pelagica TaxID=2961599 RepID=UPI0020C51C45|nr:hypothetical protein [Halomarina sp. BND7]